MKEQAFKHYRKVLTLLFSLASGKEIPVWSYLVSPCLLASRYSTLELSKLPPL